MGTEESISFSRSADMPFVELMSVRNTRRHFGAFHETYTFCLNAGPGGAEWLYRGKRRSGQGKMVMLMEPGETHRTVKLLAPTESFGVCHLNAQWMQRMAAAAAIRTPHFAAAALTHPGAYGELSAFMRAMAGGASLLERETRLILFVQAALHHGAERGSAPGGACEAPVNLRRARDWLVENHDRKIVLDDLAGASGLSKFHLIRGFTRFYGMTPHVFLNHVRVSRARECLRLGEPVAGPELGFFDQSHFIQVFRKTVGTTPGHYAGLGQLSES